MSFSPFSRNAPPSLEFRPSSSERIGEKESAGIQATIAAPRAKARGRMALALGAVLAAATIIPAAVAGCSVDLQGVFCNESDDDCPESPDAGTGSDAGVGSDAGGAGSDAGIWFDASLFADGGVPDADVPMPEDELVQIFKPIRGNTVLPVTSSLDAIQDTFGPRENGVYDWHRGTDFKGNLGDPVVAVYPGVLFKIDDVASGGKNTVYIQHQFDKPVVYGDKTIKFFYTLSSHLDTIDPALVSANDNGEHPVVLQGQQIGELGHTGANSDHVHFELRLGTPCSLEYQLENPSSSCSQGFQFDPHIHPQYLFEPIAPDMHLSMIPSPDGVEGITIQFTSPDEQPLLNRVDYEFINSDTEEVVASHLLDFNRRIGYDASTLISLDTPDFQKPYMDPVNFTYQSEIYTTTIVIPNSFTDLYPNGNKSRLEVTDIWGNTKSIEW